MAFKKTYTQKSGNNLTACIFSEIEFVIATIEFINSLKYYYNANENLDLKKPKNWKIELKVNQV